MTVPSSHALSTLSRRLARGIDGGLRGGLGKGLGAALLCLTSGVFLGCSPSDSGSTGFAYVTNGIDPFWNVAGAGARAAATEFGVTVDLIYPTDIVDQKQKLEDLLVRGVGGVAISPIDGENMVPLLDKVASKTHLITHDSDAPKSKRRCFIGVDNYACGRACGDLLRESLPNGGKVALFVRGLEQQNAQLRRQGVIDSLLGRSVDATRRDAIDAKLEGNGFTVVATRLDGFDKGAAKANAEDILVVHPDLAGMVGLFAYNAPACLEALRGKDSAGTVKVVAFDEQEATLDGIADGTIIGTISQDPFQYGYHSVRILNGLVNGDESVLPAGGMHTVAPKIVTKANLAPFREKLAQDLAAGAK